MNDEDKYELSQIHIAHEKSKLYIETIRHDKSKSALHGQHDAIAFLLSLVDAQQKEIRGEEIITEEAKFDVKQLRTLFQHYHGIVHTANFIPCDANPGDECSVDGFLNWVDQQGWLLYQHTSSVFAVYMEPLDLMQGVYGPYPDLEDVKSFNAGMHVGHGKGYSIIEFPPGNVPWIERFTWHYEKDEWEEVKT